MVSLVTFHPLCVAQKNELCQSLGQVVEHELTSREALLDFLSKLSDELVAWHILAPSDVYGFYLGPIKNGEMLGQQDWDELTVPMQAGGEIVFHDSQAKLWLAPRLAKRFAVKVLGEKIHPLPEISCNYDESAVLYDLAFDDLRVRALEWEWLTFQLKQWAEKNERLPVVAEIGCGNGQMLRQLQEAGFIAHAHGFDVSEGMLERARLRGGNLDFCLIANSQIPLASDSIDVVLSFMSFRYLDWPRIAPEMKRVLTPGGLFLMVDMAGTEITTPEDNALYQETKKRTHTLHAEYPEFSENLNQLVAHPSWQEMLKHHPKRNAVEYERFLTSQFQQGIWGRLYVCYDHSLFSFSYESPRHR